MKQKIKFPCLLLLGVWLFFTFISCVSVSDPYAGIDASIQEGSFEQAIVQMEKERSNPNRSRNSVYNNPKNEILYNLDRGMVAHYAGLYKESFQYLETAERLIEEAFTKSITQEIGTFILNDNTRDYPGEDYEDLYINIFNALNFYHLGDIEGAMVEIRRLNEKALYLSDKYEKASKKVREGNSQMNQEQLSTEASRFSNSALARYMGMLFYRTVQNPDSARIEHEELQRAFSLAPEVYTNPIPSTVGEELSIPADMARLNVIAFTGLSPIKEEENIVVPLPLPAPNNSARIALPVLVGRPQFVDKVEVVLESGDQFYLEVLENMGAVARETFKSRYALTVAKTTIRAIAKAAAGAVAAKATSETKGGAAAGLAVGFAGRILAEASERADIRISRYFPNYALVGGINLEPGTYVMTVNFYGSGRLVDSQQREVSVRGNTLNLEQLVCLGTSSAPGRAAPPVVARAPRTPEPVVTPAPELIEITPPLAIEMTSPLEIEAATEPIAAEEVVVAQAAPQVEIGTVTYTNISGYFVDVNRVPTGPLYANELRRLIYRGQLTRNTLVWKDGMPDWAVAGTVEELAPLFVR